MARRYGRVPRLRELQWRARTSRVASGTERIGNEQNLGRCALADLPVEERAIHWTGAAEGRMGDCLGDRSLRGPPRAYRGIGPGVCTVCAGQPGLATAGGNAHARI